MDAKTSACVSAVTSEIYDPWARLIISSLIIINSFIKIVSFHHHSPLLLNIVKFALVLIYLGGMRQNFSGFI